MMWPIPALSNEIITFSFSPEYLSCCWIHKAHKTALPEVKAYQKYSLDSLQLENLILFNATYIKKIITTFLSSYHQQNAFIGFCLDGPLIMQEYVTLPVSTPKKEDFGITHSSGVLWGYHYLYQNEQGQFVFYVYKIPQFLLLQYKLLAIAAQCNVTRITTQSSALFTCYKQREGDTFRYSQFALDMAQHHNNPNQLLSADIVQKMMYIPPRIAVREEFLFLATHYGLFAQQG